MPGVARHYWPYVGCSSRRLRNNAAHITCQMEPQRFTPSPHLSLLTYLQLMFIGPCIIVVVEEWKTNLMSLAILFHFLCAQHVPDINISIIRSLRLCCWITTSVVLFSVRFVSEIWCGWCWVVLVLQAEALHKFSLQNEHHSTPAAPNLQHTTNWEQDDQCGNSATQSQAPDDGYINVWNMLST